MRMKEDAMLNGQLKPAYNIQHGVDSEYITWVDISAHPTDTLTLIPFLKDMEKHLSYKYSEIVADAGYESEENYLFIEENGQIAYIKPQNYEISKTRKYKKDISRRENMSYDAERDCYICKAGKELTVSNERKSKTASGYISIKTYYRCSACAGCPYKTDCIKGNNCNTPMEERNKVLHVAKKMSEKRAEDLERITTEYGTMLRMNRSIQAEGSFADVKEDMNFRRYLYRGKANALAESILLAMGRNINRMEGLDVSIEEASEIVTDLRNNMQNSQYCTEENEAYLSVAGHYLMYQDIFSLPVKESLNVYDSFKLNKDLFAYYPHPEFGGNPRQNNVVISGAKFEAVDYHDIFSELAKVDTDIKTFFEDKDNIKVSDYIKHVIRTHHRITVIHPFPEGNGRTARAFMNVQLVRAGLTPLYIKVEEKKNYIAALEKADTEKNYDDLYECIFKVMLRSHVELSMNP